VNSNLSILALKALDCLTVRMDATAENIANANTRNYRPIAVSFEKALAQAATQGNEAIASVSPTHSRMPITTAGDSLRLDLEMQTATATAGRYAAIINILNRETQISSLALSGMK
jgi:flagellar basal-body rod protein FlgB